MLTIMEALIIMSEHFDDDRELGAYIRMITKIPMGSLDMGKFKLKLDKFRHKMGFEDTPEGLSLDDILNNAGVIKNNE